MKMLNFTLATVFHFYNATTCRSRCSLVFCIKVVLKRDLVHFEYTENREKIQRLIRSLFLYQLSRNVTL